MQDMRESVFPQINHLSRSVFCFFSSRKEIVPPSFLFRRKKWSACTGSAGPQTDGRRHILRCRRSEYRSGYASLLRLVSARVRRACAPAFPCKPTTQKKIDYGTVAFLSSCHFPQRAAQNGRFTYEPSSFFLEEKKQKKIVCGSAYFCAFVASANALHKTDGSNANRPFLCPKQDVRENVFSQIDQLSRSVFCFFSSRKEIVPL